MCAVCEVVEAEAPDNYMDAADCLSTAAKHVEAARILLARALVFHLKAEHVPDYNRPELREGQSEFEEAADKASYNLREQMRHVANLRKRIQEP